jgi:tRNA threonylcarbamoyladenosine biosynthesis protein TsaB
MYCLFLDNSHNGGVFALFKEKEVLEERFLSVTDSRQPVRIFQDFLEKRGLRLDDIEYLACGVGPGSYTGIRSACSVIRGIAFSTGKKIVSIPSLLLFALEEQGNYVIAIEGGVCGVYCQRVSFDGVQYMYEDPCVLQTNEINAFATQSSIVSPSVAWFHERGIEVVEVKKQVRGVACIAFDAYKRGCVVDEHSLQPMYLRKTQAELEASSAKILSKRS